MDDLLSDALRQLLQDQCTPQLVRAVESGQSPAGLWAQLEESGFADALVPEDQGGAGLALSDVFPLLALCGSQAVPVPLAHTMLARALLAQAGVDRPQGSIAIASVTSRQAGGVRCAFTSFGRVADWVLTAIDGATVLLPTAQAASEPGVFALDASLQWTEAALSRARQVPGAHDLEALQACAAAAQLSGALMDTFHRTLQYANERQQFGRPIGKFQAIQHQLSVMAEHAFAARMAAQMGCHSATAAPDRLRVAVAKARTSEAALEVAGLAHSIHGAIGFTAEFDLQLYTRRLHAWRQAAGSESYWQEVLGEELVDRRDGLALDLVRATTDVD
ncbi:MULTISPECIES: acyl-CoA dehydrogenase family protein [Ramlibacter]|uniref:Acyl-CoA dehydrogenase n=1 Tax=Ramlibacter pinisoli TaxID=2682844 RepID=A0A6N8IRP7_9BURK|nr:MULTISPECIES: acyl-CoA dehydrogenase family protein [Ramlibacter]MBA2963820.1 acyl-CoA dehydrogenase family protein [Ramlibacter sp. CGMCC 1.13660]MVQ28786.1 acyl-CoA dehydrogenase [Ramlibacter pinisoli]